MFEFQLLQQRDFDRSNESPFLSYLRRRRSFVFAKFRHLRSDPRRLAPNHVPYHNRAIGDHSILRHDDDAVANEVRTAGPSASDTPASFNSRAFFPMRAFLSMMARLTTFPPLSRRAAILCSRSLRMSSNV